MKTRKFKYESPIIEEIDLVMLLRGQEEPSEFDSGGLDPDKKDVTTTDENAE